MNPVLKQKISSLPKDPGVYLMKDSRGDIIYVGKAKNLKARVSSYFGAQAQKSRKTQVLVEKIFDVEVMLVHTEVEALLLERTLIKHHKPNFNILLRDDKEYPWLRVDFNEDWPRIEKVRRRKDDGAQYIGPYGSPSQLYILMEATKRIFPLIRCSRYEFKNVKRPCNYYHMKLCLGPCHIPVERAHYISMVQDALGFLTGRNTELAKSLKEKMAQASTDQNFELAAQYRDQLKAFEVVSERQQVVAPDVEDADVIGYVENETRCAFHVLMIRRKLLVSQDSFVLDAPVNDNQRAMTDFLLQYYDSRSLPREVLLPFDLEGSDDLRDALLDGHPEVQALTLKAPQRGSRHDLITMSMKNASWHMEEAGRSIDQKHIELDLVKKKLKLARLPKRMECIDISNLGEMAIVASDVCFIDGKPAKEHYRHYSIKDVTDRPNDFDSIREVMRRRLERGIRDDDLPDLMVIDGGKGQLSSAYEIMTGFEQEHGPLPMDLISIAKSKPKKDKSDSKFINAANPERSFERVFFPNAATSVPLAPGTAEYRLLTQIRDEAHRFAITHHRKQRSKQAHQSELEQIPGIGPTIRKRLLTEFGSLTELRKANLDQLKKVKGLRPAAAVALYAFFRGEED